ncbi:DUF4430 domain-containing protein [Ruminococcus sp. Marseille-P6503]|uniref:DUF4430 domain-containing protein n=1 Tax=Ruminococcus sp. Marseille-P6503 TaxID=2364796 RepID=UPI000F521383|nr:DUF4430 domain-containing protein [Ruminococcus sp. Marseille-P6503]
MLERLKKYKFRIAGAVIAAGILAAAYWYEGDSPDSHGWVITESSSDSSVTSQDTWSPDLIVQNDAQDSSYTRKADLSDTDGSFPAEASEEKTEASDAASQAEETENTSLVIKDTESRETAQPQESSAAETGAYFGQSQQPEKSEPECTVSVSCAAVLDNMDKLDSDKHELVPSDGWLLSETQAVLNDGETVFDVLQRVCRDNGIHLESSWTPLYDSAYIEGIGNLYEFDCGSLSGWMYSVNGEFPNYSCSQYIPEDGDVICFVYTCELGKDVGGDYYGQNQ